MKLILRSDMHANMEVCKQDERRQIQYFRYI